MNKTLRLALALVLAHGMVFALTACEQHDCEKDGHEFVDGVCKHCGEEEAPAGGDLPAGLPIEDGKVTFWLTLTDIELKEWNSIWLCGPMNYTAESTDFGATATEMTRLGETNVYYALVDVAGVEAGLTAAANPGEYQLTLGWNANSGAAAEKQGVNWMYKFDQTTSGLDNPKWADLYTAGTTNINLGEVKFSCGQPGAPVKLEKVTFQVEFTTAVPEGWVIYMPGSHTGWNNNIGDHMRMTPSEDRKTWSLEVTNIYEGSYEYQILAEKADAEALTWANHTVGAPEGNETVELTGRDNNNVVPLRGEPASFAEGLFDAKAKATNVTIVVKLATALPEGWTIYLPGTITSWTPSAHAMTPSADGLTWTFVIESIDVGDYECQAVAGNSASVADAWTYKAQGPNLTLTITEADSNGQIVVIENVTYTIGE